MKRNVVYETWCETCRQEEEKTREIGNWEEAKLYKYIGESSRSCYERGWEYQGDFEQLKPGSHMLKHILDMHEGKQPCEVKFQMRAIKLHRSAFERQVHEAVLIQANRGHNILNSRSEYNRCALPRLGTKLGERETKEKRQEVEEEAEGTRAGGQNQRPKKRQTANEKGWRTAKSTNEKEAEDRS
jgi:hypothetical protein